MKELKHLDSSDKMALTSLPPFPPVLLPQSHLSPLAAYRREKKSHTCGCVAAENWEALLLKCMKTKCILWPFNLSQIPFGCLCGSPFLLMIGPFCTAWPSLSQDWQPQVQVLALLTSSHSIIQSHKKQGSLQFHFQQVWTVWGVYS